MQAQKVSLSRKTMRFWWFKMIKVEKVIKQAIHIKNQIKLIMIS